MPVLTHHQACCGMGLDPALHGTVSQGRVTQQAREVRQSSSGCDHCLQPKLPAAQLPVEVPRLGTWGESCTDTEIQRSPWVLCPLHLVQGGMDTGLGWWHRVQGPKSGWAACLGLSRVTLDIPWYYRQVKLRPTPAGSVAKPTRPLRVTGTRTFCFSGH